MLIQSSFSSAIDSSFSDHGQQPFSCLWIPSEGTLQDDDSCSQNFLTSSQLSTKINMSKSSNPNLVYKRRKIQSNSAADLSVSQNSTPTLVYQRRNIRRNPCDYSDLIQDESKRLDLASVSGSFDGVSPGHERVIEEDPKTKMQKDLDFSAVNDRCSIDDAGDCSSSGAPFTAHCSKKLTDVKKDIYYLRSCKVSEMMQKMVICDLCEESFNGSYNEVNFINEGLCRSCLRKKLKKLKERSHSKSPKDYSGQIAFMLRDDDPYTTNVRIGEDFQAEVPDWSGPITDDLNDYGELVEMSPSESASYQGWNFSKLSRLGSIGNWLQCRAVIDDDGTICGKWRRAPLFEVQTGDFECFCSVLWDPTHADCAVPQELDTMQVLKQLKLIEMLRPRLSTKRSKLRVNKAVDYART